MQSGSLALSVGGLDLGLVVSVRGSLWLTVCVGKMHFFMFSQGVTYIVFVMWVAASSKVAGHQAAM